MRSNSYKTGMSFMSNEQQIKQDIGARLDNVEYQLNEVISKGLATEFSDISYQYAHEKDEIDLRELWRIIWSGKWIIISVTLIFAVVSVLYALSLPNIYKSEALLAPAEDKSGGGLSGLAGQFGGLASLAGVNLGSGGNDKTALAIEVLKSRKFINKFIETREILIPLMSANGWDGKNLIIDSDIYDEANERWVRKATPPLKSKPSSQEAYKAFMEILSVTEDKTGSFVSIGVEFYSPELAKHWVDWLVKDINREIKAREVAEAKKSIRYLSGQIEKTPIADMQAIFYELIEEQSKTIMFAEVRDEYVFKTIDDAISPELKSKPKRALICILGLILGGMLGVLYILVRHFLNSNEA